MIAIEVANLDQVIGALDTFVRGAEERATLRLKAISIHALSWLTRHSPQFSGDFAANWKVDLNKVDGSFDRGAIKAKWVDPRGEAFGIEAYQQGDAPAITYAFTRGAPVIARAKIGDYVTISNSSVHDGGYAWKIENNQINFRPENHEGGRVIGRFIETFRSLPT